MSFIKRASFVTPFGQLTNSTAPDLVDRFDTTSVSWLTASGTNGYSAASSKAFITAQFASTSSTCLYGIQLNATADRWKWAGMAANLGFSRSHTDEVCIDYSQTTEYSLTTTQSGTQVGNPQSIECRFNVIRMEPI